MKEFKQSSTNIYTIIDLVGEGSNSTVFKARKTDEQSQIEMVVALKVLKSDDLVDVWKREFYSLRSVKSHNCVTLYGFERVMDKPALLLEYVEGLSLFEITQRKLLSPSLITEVIIQVYKGLNDLWDQKLLHGDLSPGNVLIATDGTVKLVDFGLGNRTSDNNYITPDFAAPEVLNNQQESSASDLYSLGKILNFLLIGHDSDIFLQKLAENLTQYEPQKRKWTSIKSENDNREQLAEFVQKLYREKKYEATKTEEYVVKSVALPIEPVPLKKRKSNLGILTIMSSIILFVLLLIIVFVGPKEKSASLIIRGKSWYKVSINGADFGYTPIDIQSIPSGTVKIRWESQNGIGEKTLTLKQGERRILSDSFFNSSSGD